MTIDETNDAALLDAFIMWRSAEAFATLVDRHAPTVQAAARRQLGKSSQADDVTQAVFLVLMQRAATIRRPELLAGWLMKVTRYCVLNTRRAAQTANHETRAAIMSPEAIPAIAPVHDRWSSDLGAHHVVSQPTCVSL